MIDNTPVSTPSSQGMTLTPLICQAVNKLAACTYTCNHIATGLQKTSDIFYDIRFKKILPFMAEFS